MASIKDPNTGEWFAGAMTEIRTKLFARGSEDMEVALEVCQATPQFLQSAVDQSSKKCKADQALFEQGQTYLRETKEIAKSIKGKGYAISEMTFEIDQKDAQEQDIRQKMQRLNEDYSKRRELSLSQHKAYKDKMRNLNKAKQVFQDNLGLEIRKIHGAKLQFVFRNISPSDPKRIYTFLMGMKEDGTYDVMSSDPPLECLSVLESQLQETNNFAAFMANIRKEFVSLAHLEA